MNDSTYIKRHIEKTVLARAEMKGAVVVTGPRQVGKTTLIRKLAPDIPEVSFDDLRLRASAADEPAAFLKIFPAPLFIDEVQYVPNILSYIKMELDANRAKGRYFLTGSQAFELMQGVTESLAGRAGVLTLYGLSLREVLGDDCRDPFIPTLGFLTGRQGRSGSLSVPQAWEMIHRGCLPELATHPGYDWQAFYSDYVKTYIERDIRRLAQVADEAAFLSFMTVCAAMSGQLLNLASLARDVGISQPTARRWLSVLQSSGLVVLVRPYSNNMIARCVKTPKLHFIDIGLAAYLTRWLSPETLMSGAFAGHAFESFVVSEILKGYANAGVEPDLYFLRDAKGNEIDLLIHANGMLHPIEIKAKGEATKRDIKAFKLLELVKGVKIGEGGVICLADNILPITDKDYTIPLWAL